MRDFVQLCSKWRWNPCAWWGRSNYKSFNLVVTVGWWSKRLLRNHIRVTERQYNFDKYWRIPRAQHRTTLPFRSKLRGTNTEKISRISGNRMRQKPIHSFSGWTVLSPKLYDHWGDSCCNHRHSNEALHHPWEHWNRWACQMLVHFRGRIFLNGTNSGH